MSTTTTTTTIHLILAMMAIPRPRRRERHRHRHVSLEALAGSGHEVGIDGTEHLDELIDSMAPSSAMGTDGIGEIAIPMYLDVYELADVMGMADTPMDPVRVRRDRRAENKVRAIQQQLQRYRLAHVIPGTKRWALTLDEQHAAGLTACRLRRRKAIVEAVWAAVAADCSDPGAS